MRSWPKANLGEAVRKTAYSLLWEVWGISRLKLLKSTGRTFKTLFENR